MNEEYFLDQKQQKIDRATERMETKHGSIRGIWENKCKVIQAEFEKTEAEEAEKSSKKKKKRKNQTPRPEGPIFPKKPTFATFQAPWWLTSNSAGPN